MKLRQIRKSKGMTQAELSEESGVRQQTISSIENGIIQSPKMETVMKLSKALGVSPTDLILDEPPAEPIDRKNKLNALRKNINGGI